MDEKLLQNTLSEATTEQGFPAKINTPLQKEVVLEDGTTVIVEGITPNKMKEILNNSREEITTFITPGEKYVDNGKDLNGVVQNYNNNISPKLELILPDEIPWNKEIKDDELGESLSALIIAADELQDNVDFILKQGDNIFDCYLEPTSETSAEIYLKEDPENNYFDIMNETDSESGNTTVIIGEITGFKDLVIGR